MVRLLTVKIFKDYYCAILINEMSKYNDNLIGSVDLKRRCFSCALRSCPCCPSLSDYSPQLFLYLLPLFWFFIL